VGTRAEICGSANSSCSAASTEVQGSAQRAGAEISTRHTHDAVEVAAASLDATIMPRGSTEPDSSNGRSELVPAIPVVSETAAAQAERIAAPILLTLASSRGPIKTPASGASVATAAELGA